jgi:amino acid transporter
MPAETQPHDPVNSTDPSGDPQLIRGVGLGGATTLNMIDMIGVGPFITIPLIIGAMGGPQAMLGWIIGAILVMCDGLVWAELGAAMPHSGGSYRYLSEIYGPGKLFRLISFLFIWQLTFSAPLSIASGCIGFAQYATYLYRPLTRELFTRDFHLPLPFIGPLDISLVGTLGTFAAIGVAALAVILLYRRITLIEKFAKFLWVGVMITIVAVIGAALWHFNPRVAFNFPPDAFTLRPEFFTGLGAAMLIAVYDYWGYYNVAFFGGETRDPGKTIPRAIMLSIGLVAVIYLVMNTSILGVIPWQDLKETAQDTPQMADARRYLISTLMERLYGHRVAVVATILIMWTAFASVFSLLLGYSRIPYAAAKDGNYFRIFSRVHKKHRFPYVSLLIMGGIAMAFCFLRLKDVVAALVVIRIMIQFLAQIVGVIVLRIRRPDMERPFKMWFYPLPAALALVGFIFVLVQRPNALKEIRYAIVLLLAGLIIYFVRSAIRREWPFQMRETQ